MNEIKFKEIHGQFKIGTVLKFHKNYKEATMLDWVFCILYAVHLTG